MIDIKGLASIYEIEEEVDRLATTIRGDSAQTNAQLMIALEIRALRWALVGAPVTVDGDSAIETIAKVIDQS